MIADAQLMFSDAQALTGTGGASTNVVNLSSDRNVGIGVGLAAVVTIDTALAGGSATFQVAIETDDTDTFSTPTTLVTSRSFNTLPAGDMVVVPIPPDMAGEAFIRLKYTLGGTTPTTTVTAVLQPMEMIQNAKAYYASGSVI